MMRCPCNGCLVDPVCKDPCDKFSEFITPVAAVVEKLMDYLERMDDSIPQKGVMRWVFEEGGEFIAIPLVFCFLKHALGMKTKINELTLFDERFGKWDERQEE